MRYLENRFHKTVTSSVKEAVEYVMGKAAPEDFVFIGGSAFVAAEAIPLFDPFDPQTCTG